MNMRIIFLFFVFFSSLCNADTEYDKAPIAGVADLIIPNNGINLIETKALEGSTSAAHRLYVFYSSVKLDREKGAYWALIEAENGGVLGQYSYGLILSKSSNPDLRIRGRYWLQLAEKNGEPLAGRALREMENK